MSKHRQWIVLSLVLLLLGGLIFAYKVVRLGFPVMPDLTSKAWTVQVRLEIQPEGGPAQAELKLPSRSRGFTLSRENFISRGFGLTLDEETFRRQADWAVRELHETRTLYYRATVIPEARQRRLAGERPPDPGYKVPTDPGTDITPRSNRGEMATKDVPWMPPRLPSVPWWRYLCLG